METSIVQRWSGRRDQYRPAGQTIDTRRYEVARIDTHAAMVFLAGSRALSGQQLGD